MKKIKQFFSSFLRRRNISKSFTREPLFLEMLAQGLGNEFITMVDIGSNDGVESIFALNLKGEKIKVHLLEPDPKNLEKSIENIRYACKSLHNIQFHQLAISNRTVVNDYFFCNPNAPHLNSATRSDEAIIAIPVIYQTLDFFLNDHKIQTPLLIKMDIEGHEVEVLEGFLNYASTRRNINILMEVHPKRYSDAHSLKKILQKYFDVGFKTLYIESAKAPISDKFSEMAMTPLRIVGKRALYQNPTNEFVLMAASKEHLININGSGKITRNIVRSMLLTRE